MSDDFPNSKLRQTFNRVISAVKVDQPLNKANKLANPCVGVPMEQEKL